MIMVQTILTFQGASRPDLIRHLGVIIFAKLGKIADL
jgi:hypothetical protein